MISREYEIFRKVDGGKARWVESAGTLDDAKARIKDLERAFPGSYFIFDRRNACFIVPSGGTALLNLAPPEDN